jgi:ABC-2 family transporter protein
MRSAFAGRNFRGLGHLEKSEDMNALVKKEIRLLLPSWIAAVLLALPPICTRSDDGIPVFLLFMGMAMLALTSIGRETSLNTFSLLLAQPMERARIWKIKLSVLAAAFLVVFAVWRLAIIFSFKDYGGSEADPEASAAVLIAGSLVLVSAFTGGLWATLLLRQIAGAFWLTLLVPAVLAGFTAAFLSENGSDYTVIAVLCVVLGIYSVGGFLFARWLFFRAQDVGWTGGIISLPEWKFFAAGYDADNSQRKRKPIFALLKKEFQLQQVGLMGAAGLLILHIGIIALRTHHQFARNSAGEILTSIFWMLWLVLPVMIGSMAVAEERRLGVMEGQLCLPVSRRVQFLIKGLLALFLGTLLGGVLPMVLETVTQNQVFKPANHPGSFEIISMQLFIAALAAWLVLVSFFASSLARNFLQAIGFAIGTFIGLMLLVPIFTNHRMFFFDSIAQQSFLPLMITIPTIIIALLWLAYLNFKNFREGWPLWRRNLLGLATAIVFVLATTAALYHRAWEVFEPAEPPHGPAKFSLVNLPVIYHQDYEDDLLVQLPDGRVWFDRIGYPRPQFDFQGRISFRDLIRAAITPFPSSIGPQRFVNGSNWVSAVVRHLDTSIQGTNGVQDYIHIAGFLETVGIQADGTLWVSDKSDSQIWNENPLIRFGDETNWQALSWSRPMSSVLLLKKNGTLWRWGNERYNWHDWPANWQPLRDFNPRQVGTNSDWKKIALNNNYLQKADGSIWSISVNTKSGQDRISRETSWDQVDFEKIPQTLNAIYGAYVHKDGTLWVGIERDRKGFRTSTIEVFQSGAETNWVSAASSGWRMGMIVALKSDGTLWQWNYHPQQFFDVRNVLTTLPIRLGIHNDWMSISEFPNGVGALAADGGLWFWPDWASYQYPPPLLKLPKQPKFLGNIFRDSH